MSIPDVRAHLSEVMAITEHGLQVLSQQLQTLSAGGNMKAARGRTVSTIARNRVAVIPVIGPLTHRPTWIGSILGWTSAQEISAVLSQHLTDQSIDGIVLEIDSPGGSVFGIQELAEEIYKARSVKPIIAFASPVAASAAYWIGSAAREFWVMPSGMVGSIGVIAIHVDYSRALDAEGVTPTIITTSPRKADGNSYEPLSPTARASLTNQMQAYHRSFVAAVARGRRVGAATVESNFGQGDLLSANEALAVGMVDGIASSLGELMMGSKSAGNSRAKAMSESDSQRAEVDIAIAQALAS